MNYKRSEGKYYKDNPESVWKRDQTKMFVNGKYISKAHPLHKPGKYKNFEDAWEECLNIISEAEKDNSLLSILWHQRVFYEKDFPNYTKLYESIIKECIRRKAWFGTSKEVYEHVKKGYK